jgi:hypothetical protein
MTPAEIAKKVMAEIPDKGSNTEVHFEAVRTLIEQAIVEDRARWSLRFGYIQNVLGPKPMCAENNCEGCQVEMEQALEAAKLALEEIHGEPSGKSV